MMLVYYIAIAVDSNIYSHHVLVVLNYILKAIISIPIWWILFSKLAHISLWKKLIIHLFLLPFFTIVWMYTYYELCDILGLYRLTGSRKIWDVYITSLFYIIQFGNLHVLDYYKKWQKREVENALLKQLAVESELSALKAQLNPHFLYNVFNTINASVPASQESTRVMIAKLSDLFRYQLKASRNKLVTIKEEIDFVDKYLELEKQRFGERLNYQIDVDSEIVSYKIPPIILQPIVENAIKHGISPLIQGGEVHVRLSRKKEAIEVEVRDTGKGVEAVDKVELLKKGVGLSNTHERLEKLYGSELYFVDNYPQGLVVHFLIPIEPFTLNKV